MVSKVGARAHVITFCSRIMGVHGKRFRAKMVSKLFTIKFWKFLNFDDTRYSMIFFLLFFICNKTLFARRLKVINIKNVNTPENTVSQYIHMLVFTVYKIYLFFFPPHNMYNN